MHPKRPPEDNLLQKKGEPSTMKNRDERTAMDKRGGLLTPGTGSEGGFTVEVATFLYTAGPDDWDPVN